MNQSNNPPAEYNASIQKTPEGVPEGAYSIDDESECDGTVHEGPDGGLYCEPDGSDSADESDGDGGDSNDDEGGDLSSTFEDNAPDEYDGSEESEESLQSATEEIVAEGATVTEALEIAQDEVEGLDERGERVVVESAYINQSERVEIGGAEVDASPVVRDAFSAEESAIRQAAESLLDTETYEHPRISDEHESYQDFNGWREERDGSLLNSDTADLWGAAIDTTGNENIPDDATENPNTVGDPLPAAEGDEPVTALGDSISATRETLRETFGETVPVARGVSGEFAEEIKEAVENGEEVEIDHRALESWSTFPAHSEEFAGDDGVLITTEVPVDEVWGSSHSTPGLDESENELIVGKEGTESYTAENIITTSETNVSDAYQSFGDAWDNDETSKTAALMKNSPNMKSEIPTSQGGWVHNVATQEVYDDSGLETEPEETDTNAMRNNQHNSSSSTDPQTVTRTATPDGVVTRDLDGEEQDMIRVPVSSTRPDREGDRFSKEALESMAEQIRAENPMVFDNHGLAGSWMDAIPYDSRESIGAQMDAELESAEDGEWDLYSLVNPDGTHEEGERMLRQVRDEGQPIKYSVGFRVLSYEPIEDDAGNEIGREFTDADLMETSRVGIPANPDASVTQSMTAKGGGEALPGVQNHPMFQMMRAMGHGGTPEAAERDTAGHAVTKSPVDADTVEDATPTRVDGQPETTERDAVADGGGSKEDKPKCDTDADCPEGQVCEDGHCVDAEEASTTPDDGRAFEDVGMAEFDEFVAAHQEGASADEVGDALDSVGEWVGQLSRDETVALVAEACGESEDTVNEQFGEWLGDGGGDDTEEESGDLPDAYRDLREENEQLREEVAEIRQSLGDGRADAETGDTTVEADAPEPEETDDPDDDSTESKTAMDVARGS